MSQNRIHATAITRDRETPTVLFTRSVVFIKRWKDGDGSLAPDQYAVYFNLYENPRRIKMKDADIPFPSVVERNGDQVFINPDYIKSYRRFFDRSDGDKWLIELNTRFPSASEESKGVFFIVGEIPKELA